MDTRLEVVIVPVADVDRARSFYLQLGWRLDADVTTDEVRIVQLTPPGSACSVMFGDGITSLPPGSAQGMHLAVPDLEAARAGLVGRGVAVSEIFHDVAGTVHPALATTPVPGLDPRRRSHTSFATFDDPDGNGWLLQEVNAPHPQR